MVVPRTAERSKLMPHAPELYVVNEVRPGQDPRQLGDLSVFSSAEAVTSFFEPWYVDETYLLLNQNAKRRVFEAVEGGIVITDPNDQSDYSDTLRKFSIHHLSAAEHATGVRNRVPTDLSRLATEELVRLSSSMPSWASAPLRSWTKVGRIILAIWLTLAITLFVLSQFYVLSAKGNDYKSDADILLFYGMFVLTFPAAYIGVAFTILYSLLFLQPRPTNPLDLFVTWAAFTAVGYAQWFIFIPWIFKKIFRRKQRSNG